MNFKMRFSMFVTLLFIGFQYVMAQDQNTKPVKFIEVTGTAEMDVVPDEIYVAITLQEYKEGNTKVQIAQMEKDFREVLTAMKIDEKNLVLTGSYGYQYQRRKHKEKDFFMSKSYQLKMADLAKYDELIDRLDDKGIGNVYIAETKHSKMAEFRKQIKAEAMRAAKEKAKYLLEAINEQLGEALEVHELEDQGYMPVYAMRGMVSNSMMKMEDSAAPETSIEMKKIKIKYAMQVKFAIR